jgi:phosphoribosylformimino-5-aminoimidazole carboxamide ribotide isomerase
LVAKEGSVVSNNFELLPAIDIAAGKSVRLSQGRQDAATDLVDPTSIADSFQSAGTTWIHLVDLDQAFRRGENSQLIAKIVSEYPEISFQLSGGISNQETLKRALDAGAARVNLSALALEDKSWLEQTFTSSANLAFSLDVLEGQVVPRGFKDSFGSVAEVTAFLDGAGCQKYVVTDVERDGMLLGPNLDLLKRVFDFTGKPVIASGGISSLNDIEALLGMGNYSVAGAILGRALYSGNFSLTDALKLVAGND